ncbi:SpoIIE family protein phosphatase [Bacteroidota bacterium]
MNQAKKRKSLFVILLTRIIAVVLLLNIIQAGMNIRESVEMKKKADEELRIKIKDEILTTVDFLNSSLISIEKIFYYMQSKAASELINLQEKRNLKYIDLHDQLKKLDLDSVYHDIYIIEKGKVINTTYEPDLGLDLYSFGENYKNSLLNILKSGEFTPENFAFEVTSKRLKRFSYQATKDKKYIVEIGSYSETADEVVSLFNNQLKAFPKEYKDILSVNYWLGSKKPFAIINDTFNTVIQDSVIINVFENQSDIKNPSTRNNRKLITEYIYIPAENDLSTGAVATIIFDITDQSKPIFDIIKRQSMITLGFLVLLFIIIILVTRNLKHMMSDFLAKTSAIAGGAFHERVNVTGNNEFTTLAEQFNYMVEEVESSYNQLDKKNKIIQENNKILKNQKDEISQQRDILFSQKKEITDSIKYAELIQQAVLPTQDILKDNLKDYFVLFKPRDIVSGDFFWMKEMNNKIIIVAADCTGHGVPGAFMSMLGISYLNEIVSHYKILDPGEILNRLRYQVKTSLRQEGKEKEQKDGMDIALCMFDIKNRKLEFSGAYNPLFVIRENKNGNNPEEKYELIQIKADRQPIAIYEYETSFTTHKIDLKKDDSIYIFTDGYVDQIGGAKQKKFMIKNFKLALLKIQEKTMQEQKADLEEILRLWQGKMEQLDDILVIGMKV